MLTTTIDKNYFVCNMFLRLISASVVNIHEDLPGCGRNYYIGQVCVQTRVQSLFLHSERSNTGQALRAFQGTGRTANNFQAPVKAHP